jgi:hypothetical protein
MLPAFLNTSQETVRNPRTRTTSLKDVINSIVALQVTSGITFGLVLGQLIITLTVMSKPVVIYSAPTPRPATGGLIYR